MGELGPQLQYTPLFLRFGAARPDASLLPPRAPAAPAAPVAPVAAPDDTLSALEERPRVITPVVRDPAGEALGPRPEAADPEAERRRVAAARAPAIAAPAVVAPPVVSTPTDIRISDFDRNRLVQSGARPGRGQQAVELGLETGRAAQRLLNANGYNLEVDGRPGRLFRQAVADFIKKNPSAGPGSGHGTTLTPQILDALSRRAAESPATRGRTFNGYENATPRERATGNMLALLNSQDPKRFDALLRRAGVQIPADGNITPALAAKVAGAIEAPTRGHGVPMNEQTNARLSFDTAPAPNGEWNYEAARVAADLGSGRARPDAADPQRLTRNLDRAIFTDARLQRAATEAGIPVHHLQATVAVESDGKWLEANQYNAVGFTQVTPGLASEWRQRDGRLVHVGWQGTEDLRRPAGQRRIAGEPVNVHNETMNLRLGAAHLARLYDEASRAMHLPTGGARDNDRVWSTVHASYNAGTGRLRRFVGTPNFAETRNHVDQVRAYIALFGARAGFTPPS